MLEAALGNEVLPAAELTQRLGCSQATFSRLIARLGGRVLSLGRGRATRYALARDAGLALPVPAAQVDATGQLGLVAELFTIGRPSATRLAWVAGAGNRAPEIFEGLPWFMADMRPQGFLGRSFPRRVPALGLPPSIADWDDRHVLRALAQAVNLGCSPPAEEPAGSPCRLASASVA